MSTRRLMVTTLAMALIGVFLERLGADAAALREALVHPQRVGDAAGPDAVVAAWAAACAWVVWAWGVLGLGLTAATAVPGLLGRTARTLLRLVLPAGARRAAAVALGFGLGVGLGAPVLASAAPAASVAVSAPDWPTRLPADPAPDRPGATPTPDWPAPMPGDHVVVRGDCLWDIATARLAAEAGRTPTDGQTADAVRAWWTANSSAIGPDPDLLLPGQVLHPPGPD